MPTTASTFTMLEAVELAHATAQRIAVEADIRVLFIKGPSLTFHGLRESWGSSDVDLLVEPARFEEFCALLSTIGWHERPGIESLTVLHSKTFFKQTWPCDLDPHVTFPGFLATPELAFEALWKRRVEMPLANRTCTVADKLGSILIMTLHSLRGSSRHPRHKRELESLKKIQLSGIEKIDLKALAHDTGSTATAVSILGALGVDAVPSEQELRSEEYREWQRRVLTSTHGAYPWLVAFSQGNAREKAKIIWHAIWPPEEELRRARPNLRADKLGAVLGRITRWGRGLASLPGGLRMLRTRRATDAKINR